MNQITQSWIRGQLAEFCQRCNLHEKPVEVFWNHLLDHADPADLFDILHMLGVAQCALEITDVIINDQVSAEFMGMGKMTLKERQEVRQAVGYAGLFHDWALVLARDYLKNKFNLSGPVKRFAKEHHQRSKIVAAEVMKPLIGSVLSDRVYSIMLEMISLNGEELGQNPRYLQLHALADETLNHAQMAPWRMLGYFHLELSDHIANFEEGLFAEQGFTAAMESSIDFWKRHRSKTWRVYNEISNIPEEALAEIVRHLAKDKKINYWFEFQSACPGACQRLLEIAFTRNIAPFYLECPLVALTLGAAWRLIKDALASGTYGASCHDNLETYRQMVLEAISGYYS